MNGGKEDGVVAGIGIQPTGELAQMARAGLLCPRIVYTDLNGLFCKISGPGL